RRDLDFMSPGVRCPVIVRRTNLPNGKLSSPNTMTIDGRNQSHPRATLTVRQRANAATLRRTLGPAASLKGSGALCAQKIRGVLTPTLSPQERETRCPTLHTLHITVAVG